MGGGGAYDQMYFAYNWGGAYKWGVLHFVYTAVHNILSYMVIFIMGKSLWAFFTRQPYCPERLK